MTDKNGNTYRVGGIIDFQGARTTTKTEFDAYQLEMSVASFAVASLIFSHFNYLNTRG